MKLLGSLFYRRQSYITIGYGSPIISCIYSSISSLLINKKKKETLPRKNFGRRFFVKIEQLQLTGLKVIF
jgi:hypothetical protein